MCLSFLMSRGWTLKSEKSPKSTVCARNEKIDLLPAIVIPLFLTTMTLTGLLIFIFLMPTGIVFRMDEIIDSFNTFDDRHRHILRSSYGVRRRFPTSSINQKVGVKSFYLWLGTFESFLSPKVTSIFKHISGVVMQRPVRAFAGLVRTSWNLDKAIVEWERVANWILPSE